MLILPSDAGIYDCGFYPGSYGYEELDADTYASWGIDYLKYDNCGGFQANTLSPQERFTIMANALKNTGREIFYSLCQWGNQFPWFWADQFSDSYRMSGDIKSSFASDSSGVCKTAYCLNTGYAGVSVLTMIRKMRELSGFQAPGSWGKFELYLKMVVLKMVHSGYGHARNRDGNNDRIRRADTLLLLGGSQIAPHHRRRYHDDLEFFTRYSPQQRNRRDLTR